MKKHIKIFLQGLVGLGVMGLFILVLHGPLIMCQYTENKNYLWLYSIYFILVAYIIGISMEDDLKAKEKKNET